MLWCEMRQLKRSNFIGIGGGMSGIAEVLLNEGYQISGSDLLANAATERLAEKVRQVLHGHEEQNVVKA